VIKGKPNLPALTWRDADVNDLTAFTDMQALARTGQHLPFLLAKVEHNARNNRMRATV
jgi:hypothetical protein